MAVNLMGLTGGYGAVGLYSAAGMSGTHRVPQAAYDAQGLADPMKVGDLAEQRDPGKVQSAEKEQAQDKRFLTDAEKDRQEDHKIGKKSSPEECETCKKRKYQDGSDENVSFKSAAHVSPQGAATAVRAHEQEHVVNAYSKAAKDGGKVLMASVTIHTAVCEECGRTYVSGGVTHTRIKYSNENNPYQQARRSQDAASVAGQNVNMTVG